MITALSESISAITEFSNDTQVIKKKGAKYLKCFSAKHLAIKKKDI